MEYLESVSPDAIAASARSRWITALKQYTNLFCYTLLNIAIYQTAAKEKPLRRKAPDIQ